MQAGFAEINRRLDMYMLGFVGVVISIVLTKVL
jgi:hypothetical protein